MVTVRGGRRRLVSLEVEVSAGFWAGTGLDAAGAAGFGGRGRDATGFT